MKYIVIPLIALFASPAYSQQPVRKTGLQIGIVCFGNRNQPQQQGTDPALLALIQAGQSQAAQQHSELMAWLNSQKIGANPAPQPIVINNPAPNTGGIVYSPPSGWAPIYSPPAAGPPVYTPPVTGPPVYNPQPPGPPVYKPVPPGVPLYEPPIPGQPLYRPSAPNNPAAPPAGSTPSTPYSAPYMPPAATGADSSTTRRNAPPPTGPQRLTKTQVAHAIYGGQR